MSIKNFEMGVFFAMTSAKKKGSNGSIMTNYAMISHVIISYIVCIIDILI